MIVHHVQSMLKQMMRIRHNIANYFKPGTKEIRYINLGLYEKEQADLALAHDLTNVNVGVNGYWHTYKYDKN